MDADCLMVQSSLGILDGISNPNMQHHSRSHSLWSSGLTDSDDKSAEELSDAAFGGREPRSPNGQQSCIIAVIQPPSCDPRCQRLKEAFGHAFRCKEYLAKHDADIAAAALVKACSLSTITLGLFDEHTTNWDSLLTKLQLANTRCMLTCNDMIAWAARAILIGFGHIALPADDEMHSADSKMMFWSYPGDLTGHEVLWVAHVGIFKAHWAMLKDLEPQPKVGKGRLHRDNPVFQALQEDVNVLCEMIPDHPTTLQAVSLLGQYLCKPAYPQLFQGYCTALHKYTDPATAMQHLLQYMYIELQHCNGRPKDDKKRQLIDAANKVLETHALLQESTILKCISLWDLTEDKLLAAMLMLGRTFPLHAALNGHQLAACIAEQHKQLHAKLERGESPRKTAVLLIPEQEPASTENSPVSADATPTDDVDTKRRKCHRCNRSRKELEMLMCQKCHETRYCAQQCLIIDAATHRNHCKQILLQRKVNAKRKGQLSLYTLPVQ